MRRCWSPKLLWSVLAILASIQSAWAFEKSDLAKVAAIEKIAGFIQWPQPSATLFKICVDANNPLVDVLQNYYVQRQIAGKPATIVTIDSDAPPPDCQVYYLSAVKPLRLPLLLAWSAKHNVLLVTDTPDAATMGAHVVFYFSMNHIQIEVNRKSMMASGLQPSFKLLQVVKIVE